MDVNEVAHTLGIVFCCSPLSDFDLAPGTMHVEENEEIDRAIATILVIVTVEPAGLDRDGLTCLADELHRAFVEAHHRPLGIGRLGVEVEDILHAGDVFAIDLRNAPHVFAPGFEVILGQASPNRFVRQAVVFGELDHRTCQQLERPAGTTLWRIGAGCRHQQGFFLAREFAFRPGARFVAQRPLQIAFHEASLGPVHGRAAYADAPRDLVVAAPSIGGQQNLCSLELAGGMLAAAEKRLEFDALDLAEFDPIAYIHACLLERGTHEQLSRMAGVSPSAKTFTPKQGQYLAFIHLYTRLHRRPPAETDMQEYFRVSPPSVHQMVLTLERASLIRRQPRTPRRIQVLVDPKHLPELI